MAEAEDVQFALWTLAKALRNRGNGNDKEVQDMRPDGDISSETAASNLATDQNLCGAGGCNRKI